MRKLFTLLVGLLLLSGALTAQAPAGSGSLRADVPTGGFGYALRTPTDTTGVGEGNKYMVALIELPPMGGNVLRGISFCTRFDDALKGGAVIIAEANGKILYKQAANITAGWNKVSLADPFTLKANTTYLVGYETKCGLGNKLYTAAFDGAPNEEQAPEATWVSYSAAEYREGDQIQFLQQLAGKKGPFNKMNVGNLMIFADIEDTSHPLENAFYPYSARFEGDKFLAADASVNVLISGRNLSSGNKALTELSVSYEMGMDAALTARAVPTTDGTLAPSVAGDVAFKVQTPSDGFGRLSVSVQQVNGTANIFAHKPVVALYTIQGSSQGIPRENILIEHFTTEECGNCPTADPKIEQMMEQLKEEGVQVNYIAHHSGYKTDRYTLTQDKEIMPYLYMANGGFAPAVGYDRRLFSGEDRILLSANLIDLTAYGRRAREFAQMIHIDALEVSSQATEGGENVTATLTGKMVGPFNTDNLFAEMVITEDDIHSTTQGGVQPWGSDYVHNGVPRLYLTPTGGTRVAIQDDGTFSVTATGFMLNVFGYKKENLKVVALVCNGLTGEDPAERFVHASCTAPFGGSYNRIDTPLKDLNIGVRNGYLQLDGAFAAVQVYNVSGALVSTSAQTQLGRGLYIVRVLLPDASTRVAKVLVP